MIPLLENVNEFFLLKLLICPQVPDSAGTATAIFSGVKTKMAVLGVDNKITRRVCDPEVLERAKVQGMLHWAQAAGKDTGKSRNELF